MTAQEIEALRVLNRMLRSVTGWEVMEVLREFPANSEGLEAQGIFGPYLAGEDRTRN